MISKNPKHALELSLVPAVLASSCCLTVPSLALLGISFSENIFYDHRYLLRILAIVVMFISLATYFYIKGIKSANDIVNEQRNILIITTQTLVFGVMIYAIFLYLITPQLCLLAQIGTCIAI